MHRSIQLTKAASFRHTIGSPRRGPGTLKASWTLSLFSLSHRSPPLAHEKSLFFQQGDYWIIGYRTAVAFLKATRGLQDLALLLGNPGREFHVCELVGRGIGKPLLCGKRRARRSCLAGWTSVRCWSDPGQRQTKDDYKRRLDELRNDWRRP